MFVAKQRDGAFCGVGVVVRTSYYGVITVPANIERTAEGSHILSLKMRGGRGGKSSTSSLFCKLVRKLRGQAWNLTQSHAYSSFARRWASQAKFRPRTSACRRSTSRSSTPDLNDGDVECIISVRDVAARQKFQKPLTEEHRGPRGRGRGQGAVPSAGGGR